MKESKFDKTVYAEKTFKEADNTVSYWRTRPMWERLQAGYHLSLRAYGYDPEGPDPKLDVSIFEIRRSSKSQ
ncbi:MAG: hypothetical protein ACI86M_001811 [Saprospiraceae bacterium]|jgi:hypothetical protein